MTIDIVVDIEAEIESFISGGIPAIGSWTRAAPSRPRRYASDGFAQGVLLDRLEASGFIHEHLPTLEIWLAGGESECCHGSRFTHLVSGRYIQTYHGDAGVALASAALMALRHCARGEVIPTLPARR